ncbi:MAG: MerR family transcriptional regulator [Chloroflexota bacterium]
MFRIGEFSKIAQTADSQLRYYDQIGLFQPQHIDEFTGYRYYSASQLPELNRILALKDLGMSLDQIKRMVLDDVSAEEIRGMLTLRKSQVEQDLRAEVDRLRSIEARLRQVETAGQLDQDDIVLKEIQSQPFFSFRNNFETLFAAGAQVVEMTQIIPAKVPKKKLGHFTAIIHGEAFSVENADVEIGYLLNDGIDQPLLLSGGEEVKMRILPKIELAACAVRLGVFENGFEKYAAVGQWVESNGYQLAGPAREVFIVPPHPERMEETVCEIQIPVKVNQRSFAQLI